MMLVALDMATSHDITSSLTSFKSLCNTSNAFLLSWIAISLCFAFIVRRWKQHDGILQGCCPKRKARFFKCAKRCERRKAQKEEAQQEETNWNCPFECAFARIHMPAPLPFRKKKKRSSVVKRQSSTTTTAKIRSLDGIHTTAMELEDQEIRLEHQDTDDIPDISSSSDESLTSSESSTDDAPTSKSRRRRRRRRNRRGSSSFKDVTSTATDICSTPSSLPVSPSKLIDLALMQNWQQLLVNLKANRRSARERDADGLYPLHWAVSSAPPIEIVRDLLRAYPGATKKADSEGSLPLHFAAHYGGSVAMMDLLMETNPKAIRVQDKFGRTPLYHAVDKSANIDVLRALATADRNMITTACRPQETKGERFDYLTPLYLAWVNFMIDKRSVETCEGKIWDKASLLLDMAYCHQYDLSDEVDVPVVVAAVALDALLPEELAEVMIGGVSSNELLKVDPITGKNPLGLAASMKLSPQRSCKLIHLLLDACPSAATALDRDGRTALANAAESGKSWDLGLARLVQAAPEAMGLFDRTTGLTPSLLLAASSPQTIENESTGLILADPYNLVGAKSMSLRYRVLEQRRQQKRTASAIDNVRTPPSEKERENQHLSSLFQLIKEDPSWIVTA